MRRFVSALLTLVLCAAGAVLPATAARADHAPVVTIDEKPPAVTASTSAHFAVSSDDPALDRLWCRVDFVTVDCADGTVDVTGLDGNSGSHHFHVQGFDAADHFGPMVEYQWVVDLTRPAVAIGVYGTSLTTPRVVYFDELVTGVTSSNVRFRLYGTTTDVPSSRTCRDEANVHVSCASKRVRDVLVTPTRPLVPGQLYRISVSGVPDLVGNLNEPTGRTFRASVREQENSSGATPRWQTVASPSAQGGSYTVAHLRGASATYRFTGTGITWYSRRGRLTGFADVYVDGVHRETVNFYSPTSGSESYAVTGLTSARHSLTIVARNERGSPGGTGTDVAVDAFKVGGTTSASPRPAYAWARRAASSASGGAFAFEDLAGASYSVTFRGRGFTWVTVLGPNMGRATVRIDGVAKGTFDNWASATTYGAVRSFPGLADAVHTVTITVVGQHRPGATGSFVAVDRFGIQV